MQTKQKMEQLKSLDKTLYNMMAYFQIDKIDIPLSREKFTNYIISIKGQSFYLDDLNSLNRKYNIDVSICSSPLEDDLVDLLIYIFNDNKNDWISYWIYELNFGEDANSMTASIESDISETGSFAIPLETIDDLYNLLIAEYNDCLDNYLYTFWKLQKDGVGGWK